MTVTKSIAMAALFAVLSACSTFAETEPRFFYKAGNVSACNSASSVYGGQFIGGSTIAVVQEKDQSRVDCYSRVVTVPDGTDLRDQGVVRAVAAENDIRVTNFTFLRGSECTESNLDPDSDRGQCLRDDGVAGTVDSNLRGQRSSNDEL